MKDENQQSYLLSEDDDGLSSLGLLTVLSSLVSVEICSPSRSSYGIPIILLRTFKALPEILERQQSKTICISSFWSESKVKPQVVQHVGAKTK